MLLRSSLTVSAVTTCLVAIAVGPATTQSVVTVDMKPANIQQQSFNPDKPPEGIPLNPDIEAACSAALFSCHSDVDLVITAEKRVAAGTEITAEIKAIHVTLCLDDTLWLPDGASAKLLAHEKGHAKISEKFFAQAQAPVEKKAANLIGQTITAEGADHQTALAAAAEKVNDRIARVYLQETTTASTPVQQAYDKLTDHSRNKVPEEKAIPLAMKHAGIPPATQPDELLK